ncbi:hypothetical protein [Micromonospora sp. KC207]|uniref:hypothetical protein n=1 Tax=Micromonospora sp. KC207 TaxID=2530377 RepID=UPI001A9FC024|nr:hypothetical protein [Micromonospora sp. KC207]
MATAAAAATTLLVGPTAAHATEYATYYMGPYADLARCNANSVASHDPEGGSFASPCFYSTSAPAGYYFILRVSLD